MVNNRDGFHLTEVLDKETPFPFFLFAVMLLDYEPDMKVKQRRINGSRYRSDKVMNMISYADVLLISRVTLSNCWELKDSLDEFKSLTNLQVNIGKYSIMLSLSLYPKLKKIIRNQFKFGKEDIW